MFDNKNKLLTKERVLLILLIIFGIHGNYKKVEKVDPALLKEMVIWIPRIEEIHNSDVEFTQEYYSEFQGAMEKPVYVNDRSKREIEYMGKTKVLASVAYDIKYYESKGNRQEVGKAEKQYSECKYELKMILEKYREKYDYVNELWEQGIF